jgi:Tfp pilus assembly protein PilO
MQEQKADCEKIIESKNELIAQMKKDLKAKDNDFTRLLKQQMDDMSRMLKAMTQQLDGMSAACRCVMRITNSGLAFLCCPW